MFNKVQQFFRAVSNKKFRENPKAPRLAVDDQRALLVGLINGEQITSYYNSLTTGLPRGQMRQNLQEYYDVASPEGAVATLDWLLNEGHRAIFNDILPIIGTVTGMDARREAIYALYNARLQQAAEEAAGDEEKIERAKAKCEEDCAQAVDFGNKLKGIMNGARGKDPFVPFSERNVGRGILAWDMGRLVTVARSAFDAGYIDEPTAWDYIRRGWQLAAQEYATWEELTTAYLIGRGTWGGDTLMLNGMYGIANDCLTDEKSPWKTLTLK
jgi:hypothetical protein